MGLALTAWNVNACLVSGVVSCPNGTSGVGIGVTVTAGGTTFGSANTDANGAYSIEMPTLGPGTYQVCVDPSTLPSGFTSVSGCQTIIVNLGDTFFNADFTLDGPACSTPPPPGPCWLTGGGTMAKVKGVPVASFGGVVNPGCSPTAAGGGNWNVVSHLLKLHFKGLFIDVIGCSGQPTKSPKVNVNIIDFEGVGTIEGIDGNPMARTAVCFRARAEDHGESGGGKDRLYLNVYDCTSGGTYMLISTDLGNPTNIAPDTLSTGNLQIHTTGCNK
jgi:hypothetical protein